MQYLPNPDEQRWLVRYTRRMIENMGYEQFVLAPILEPSRKWFPVLFGAAMLGVMVIPRLSTGDLTDNVATIGMVGFFAFLLASFYFARKANKPYFCSDRDCRHVLTLQDTVCRGCGGTIAESAEDALERNSASFEFTECPDCQPEEPCAQHAIADR
jgi:hypothetical protein